MNRFKYRMLLSLMLLPLVSSAATQTVHVTPGATPFAGVEKAPDPINKTPRFSYWKRSWDQSNAANAETLKGTWRSVGRATTQTCSFEFPDAFNENGLKNRDGSLEQLIFADYPGPRGEKIFGVKALNLGSQAADQGPFSVEATEPQYSLWGYINTEVTHQVFYEQSCRLETSGQLLICLAKLTLLDPAPGQPWDRESVACAADPYAHVVVYKRSPKKDF